MSDARPAPKRSVARVSGSAATGSAPAPGSTWIGKGTALEGNVKTQEDICIQGRLKGSVESSAAVVVPPEGDVEADIVARTVTVQGRVVGNVEALERAEIGESGTLVGSILAGTVVVQAGATFEGAVHSRARRAEARDAAPAGESGPPPEAAGDPA